MKTIETTILKNLVHNEDYLRKVIPFLKEEYFQDNADKVVFNLIEEFVKKYNKPPTLEALDISSQNSSLTEGQFSEVSSLLKELNNKDESNNEWLIEETEKFCKDKAVYNAILASIGILDGKDKEQ